MLGSAQNRPYEDATGWWGPVWHEADPRSLLDLIASGGVDASAAAFLWSHLDRRGSLAVVAGPSGAGKTTLLTAFADLLPASERRVYLRGIHEPFAFLADPDVDPARTTLMVNEISPHLPLYLWGPAVRRLMASLPRGFRLLATAHAESAQELVGQLAGYPLRAPAPEIASIEVVAVVRAWREGQAVRRRLTEITGLVGSERGGVMVRPIMTGGGQAIDGDEAALWLAARGAGTAADAGRDLTHRAAAIQQLLEVGREHAKGAQLRDQMALALALERSRDGASDPT